MPTACDPRRAHRRLTLLLAALSLGASVAARAAHPLLSEDTGTQGKGRFELELGLSRATDGDLRAFEFGPQLSFGVTETFDAIVRPTWLENRSSGDAPSRVSGIGDTAIDGKWRFFEEGDFSLGTRLGILVPTGDNDAGLSQRKASFHGVLIAQMVRNAWTFIGNVGYVHDPVAGDRSALWFGTASAVWQADERWKFSAEVGAFRNPDPAAGSWQAVSRFGVIASLAPWLDVDAGYQFRLNHAAPVRVILAGATFRW